MGDAAGMFNALKVLRQMEAAERRLVAPKKLTDAGIKFQSLNGGAHLKLVVKNLVIDFWPGTERWKVQGQAPQFGIGQLIDFVNEE